MEVFCIAVFTVELLAAIFMQLAKYKLPKKAGNSPIEAIAFIIPFHNEQERILPLIESINTSLFTGKCEFIFVNDYSTDETVSLINKHLQVPFTCINNQGDRGKKRSIKTGVLNAQYEFIVTWDADVHFKSNYIQSLFELPLADLVVLPVNMESKTLAGKLACIEFTFIETFNLGFSAFGKPIVCNGANLGFRKSVFLELNATRTDYNIPSGDDLFLLQAMLKQQKNVAVYKSGLLSVSTSAPTTFSAVIRQRQRWKGKMSSIISLASSLPLMLNILMLFATIFTIMLGIFNPIYFLLFGLKFMAEFIAAWSFIKRNSSHVFVLLIHQLWYPIYAVLLSFNFGKEKRWS